MPKCQFCEVEAKYVAASTEPTTIHNWVYVCDKDLQANAVNDDSVKALEVNQN
jgi:hypothetical protein